MSSLLEIPVESADKRGGSGGETVAAPPPPPPKHCPPMQMLAVTIYALTNFNLSPSSSSLITQHSLFYT